MHSVHIGFFFKRKSIFSFSCEGGFRPILSAKASVIFPHALFGIADNSGYFLVEFIWAVMDHLGVTIAYIFPCYVWTFFIHLYVPTGGLGYFPWECLF